MELHGTAYLYALSAVAVAFLGFTAIVVIIRQSLGDGLSSMQVLLVHTLIEHGFAVVGFALLPPLVALFDLSHDLIIRISSGAAAIGIAVWHLEFALRRYPRIAQRRPPTFAYINFAITTLFTLVLFANAAGIPFKPQIGPYASAVTWLLCQAANIFLLSFNVFLKHQKKPAISR
jgi:hypothetical protein